MYHWEYMPHLGATAGIGMGVDGEPRQFNSEEEYRNWYYRHLHEWLIWA